MSQAHPTDHRQVAGQPDHTFAHMLGGRDARDLRSEVLPLVLVIQRGTLRDDEAVYQRMVERRQCMDIDVGAFLPPTACSLCPSFLLKVVLAQSKRDDRCTVFKRRVDKGVLVYLCDSRHKLHLYGHCHLLPFTTTDVPWNMWHRG